MAIFILQDAIIRLDDFGQINLRYNASSSIKTATICREDIKHRTTNSSLHCTLLFHYHLMTIYVLISQLLV